MVGCSWSYRELVVWLNKQDVLSEETKKNRVRSYCINGIFRRHRRVSSQELDEQISKLSSGLEQKRGCQGGAVFLSIEVHRSFGGVGYLRPPKIYRAIAYSIRARHSLITALSVSAERSAIKHGISPSIV